MTTDATPGRRRTVRRWLLRGVAVIVVLLASAVAAWVLLLPSTEQGPLRAVLGDPALVVTRGAGTVTLAPAAGGSATTVVFYPGAGVPPDAYLPTWAPVVAATGATVVVPDVPLRLAVLDRDVAGDVRAALPGREDGDWWVGGHSLGGAMAASHLADAPAGAWDGLVLWAAFPPDDALADRVDLDVLSVAGTRDGLTTPQDVADSRADLPADAEVVELDGVSHAQFGAYGDQRGDGEPTVTDDAARAAVAAATAAALR